MRGSWLGVAWFLLAAMSVAGCAGRQAVAPVSTPRGTAELPENGIYVVHKGDTLYSIAWHYDLDYPTIASWNGIRDPYRIYPGQKLRLTPPSTTSSPSAVVARAPAPVPRNAPVSYAKSNPRPVAERVDGYQGRRVQPSADMVWRWPARGTVIRNYSASDPGKKGLDIAGRLGQPIIAAAAGKVVYSGSGLIGYGNLIIVKHNDSYLSAYAHGDKLLVKEGEWVKAGQPIAEMGRTGTDRVMLHFEIRRQGKPVDPLRYLPPRS
jgi:lipoprotein NlpD